MAFKISLLDNNSKRKGSILVESNTAVVSCASDSVLPCNLPKGVTLTVTETPQGLTLAAQGSPLILKGGEQQTALSINGTDFTLAGLKFYVTPQITYQEVRRKKSILANFSFILIWVLLALMFITPPMLDSMIKSQDLKGRLVLLDKCSFIIDALRATMRKELSELDKYNQSHRDIVLALNHEIEQITWIFRSNRDFMSKKKLFKLEIDLHRYEEIIRKLQTADTIKVNPLNPETVLKAVIPE